MISSSSIYSILLFPKQNALRTAATLHHTLVLGYIATEPLFLISIPVPIFLERIEVEFHDLR
jgi:hypothetical protein